MLDAETQCRRSVEIAFVIFGPPDTKARPLVDFERRIEHDGRRRIPIIEGSRVDERLERRSWLTQGLRRAIELALVVGKPADHCEHAPRLRIFDDHGARNFRNLTQCVLTVGFARFHKDHVARIDDLTDFRHRLAATAGPLRTIERQDPDRALLADESARLASRLQPDTCGLIANIENDRQPPRRDIGKPLYLRELDTPVAGNVDLGDRTAPTLLLVKAYKTIGQRFSRDHLPFGVQRGSNRKSALVKFLFAVALE